MIVAKVVTVWPPGNFACTTTHNQYAFRFHDIGILSPKCSDPASMDRLRRSPRLMVRASPLRCTTAFFSLWLFLFDFLCCLARVAHRMPSSLPGATGAQDTV